MIDLQHWDEINAFVEANWLPLLIFTIWTLTWKGWALWRAAHDERRGWFVAILLLNTLGILEIFYLGFVGRRQKPSATSSTSIEADA
ncbi:MAG: DUF5652 family protein [Patescibacteria group bacterium]